MARHVFSGELVDFIRALGLDPDLTSRIIIDIPVDGLVRVYTEQYADRAAFGIVVPPEIIQAAIRPLTAREFNAIDLHPRIDVTTPDTPET